MRAALPPGVVAARAVRSFGLAVCPGAQDSKAGLDLVYPGAHTAERRTVAMALDVAKALAVVAADCLADEGADFITAPHAQVRYLGEGPSKGDLDLARGILSAASCGDGAVAGESNFRGSKG